MFVYQTMQQNRLSCFKMMILCYIYLHMYFLLISTPKYHPLHLRQTDSTVPQAPIKQLYTFNYWVIAKNT